MIHLFKQPKMDQILRRQLDEAERHRAQYAAGAEEYIAMRQMYENRIDRLKSELDLVQPT